MKVISKEFFSGEAVKTAKKLLGKKIVFGKCSGIIVETEAYKNDSASHAHKITPRSAPIIENYGTVYVYLNYGMYYLLNFTCDIKRPGAILIRAIEPLSGINLMKKRRKTVEIKELCNGPGKLCQAFNINKNNHNKDVGDEIKIFNIGLKPKINKAKRIGISSSKDLLWRFYIKDNSFVSKR